MATGGNPDGAGLGATGGKYGFAAQRVLVDVSFDMGVRVHVQHGVSYVDALDEVRPRVRAMGEEICASVIDVIGKRWSCPGVTLGKRKERVTEVSRASDSAPHIEVGDVSLGYDVYYAELTASWTYAIAVMVDVTRDELVATLWSDVLSEITKAGDSLEPDGVMWHGPVVKSVRYQRDVYGRRDFAASDTDYIISCNGKD